MLNYHIWRLFLPIENLKEGCKLFVKKKKKKRVSKISILSKSGNV